MFKCDPILYEDPCEIQSEFSSILKMIRNVFVTLSFIFQRLHAVQMFQKLGNRVLFEFGTLKIHMWAAASKTKGKIFSVSILTEDEQLIESDDPKGLQYGSRWPKSVSVGKGNSLQ